MKKNTVPSIQSEKCVLKKAMPGLTSFRVDQYQCNGDDKDLWLFKGNKLNWVINEFVGAGIYKHYMGDYVPEVRLIRDETCPTEAIHPIVAKDRALHYELFHNRAYLSAKTETEKTAIRKQTIEKLKTTPSTMPKDFLFNEERPQCLKIATEFLNNLTPFVYDKNQPNHSYGDQGLEKPMRISGEIPMASLRGGSLVTKHHVKPTSLEEVSKYYDKPIIGFQGFMVILDLLMDYDVKNGVNFGIRDYADQKHPIHYDYDDSFSFQERDKIFNQECNISPPRLANDRAFFCSTKQYSKANLYKSLETAFGKKFAEQQNPGHLLDAIKMIAETPYGTMTNIIINKLDTVKTVISESQASKVYNRQKLIDLTKISNPEEFSTLDLLKVYLSYKVESRIDDYKNIYKCALLEIGMKFNKTELVDQFFKTDGHNNLQCVNFYSEDRHDSITPIEMAKSYNFDYQSHELASLTGASAAVDVA